MTLDEELLKKAVATGTQLADADRKLQLARAEFNTAVRRLHLAGGSFREIGSALSISHQRVQQIVEKEGGTWWQRVWKTRTVKRDTLCTFCCRPPSEVQKLIAGPNVYICDECLEGAEKKLLAAVTKGAACSFCGKRAAESRPVVATPRASVCKDCLTVCRQILDDRIEAPASIP